MINRIILQPYNNSVIEEYLRFNSIPYVVNDLWSNADNQFDIPSTFFENVNCLLVINHDVFGKFCENKTSKQKLIDFSKKNYIWLWSDIDSLVSIISNSVLLHINNFNCENITVFVDGQSEKIKFITTAKVEQLPINWFLRMPKVKYGKIEKIKCKHDFLLTTILKENREHRTILLDKINNSSLGDRGLISQNALNESLANWLGEMPATKNWPDGYPSMDLYNQCWFEIVPETLYKEGYFCTEKTVKPIATKTPFLVVSSKGYLAYLKSLGFETFNELIDESYDQHDSIEVRISLMLDQVRKIIEHGSEKFYNDAKPILDYNYNHLCELTGKWDHTMHSFITDQLNHIGFKFI